LALETSIMQSAFLRSSTDLFVHDSCDAEGAAYSSSTFRGLDRTPRRRGGARHPPSKLSKLVFLVFAELEDLVYAHLGGLGDLNFVP